MSEETTAAVDTANKSVKNFRNSVDIENFYRFIHENGLRRETISMLEFVHTSLAKPKKRGRKKKMQ